MKPDKASASPKSAPRSSAGYRARWVPWFVAAVGLGVSLSALGGDFVWDDRWLVLQSPLRNDPALLGRLLLEKHGFGSMVIGAGESGSYYRPLAALLHGLLLVSFDATALAFRLLSSAFHAGTAGLLALLLARRAGARAAWAACLFAVHPALADAWGWISALPDLLVGFWLLCAFLLLPPAEEGKRAPARSFFLGLSWFLALLSKESAVVGWLWVWLFAATGWIPALRRENTRRFLPLVVATVTYLTLRAFTVGFARGTVDSVPGLEVSGAVLIGRLLLLDVGRLLLPWQITLDPAPWALRATGAWTGWLALTAGVLATLLSIRALATSPARPRWLPLGWLLVLAALLPTLQILPTNDLFGGRFLYLPMIGLVIAFGPALADGWARHPRVVPVVLLLTTVLLGARSIARAAEWKSDATLFGAEYRLQPDSPRARVLWAGHLLNEGRGSEALPIVEESARRLPHDPRVRSQQALLWMNQGRAAEAEVVFRDLLAKWRQSPTLFGNLASCQVRLGRFEEALATLDQATRFSTPTAGMRNSRGLALWNLGRTEEARAEFDRAIAETPSAVPARVNAILLDARVGRLQEARARGEEFLLRFPEAREAERVRALLDTLRVR